MAQAGLGIAAAAVGIWLLLREVKSIELPDFSLFDVGNGGAIVGYSGEEVDRQLLERTEALQVYEQERAADAIEIEHRRARELLRQPDTSYGTIPSGITGHWAASPPAGADNCTVLFATAAASNTTRSYTGKYCREAQALGFISPFSGEAI